MQIAFHPLTATRLYPPARPARPFAGTVRFAALDPDMAAHPEKHPLYKEILQQPQILSAMVKALPVRAETLRFPFKNTKALVAVAEGSSLNAVRIAAPYIEAFTGLNLKAHTPEEILDRLATTSRFNPLRPGMPLKSELLVVSQSGGSKSVIDALAKVKEQSGGALPTTVFTNNPDSVLGKQFSNVVELNAGVEKSVAATKTMTATVMALILYGLELGLRSGQVDGSTYQDALKDLAGVGSHLRGVLKNDALHREMRWFVKSLTGTNQFIYLSQGSLAKTLPEGGLKLLETSGNDVSSYSIQSFMHGFKAMLAGVNSAPPNTVYVIPPDLSADAVKQLASNIRYHFFHQDQQVFETRRVSFITFRNGPDLSPVIAALNMAVAPQILTLPAVKNPLQADFTALAAMQLMGLYVALEKGVDPNGQNLEKIVSQ